MSEIYILALGVVFFTGLLFAFRKTPDIDSVKRAIASINEAQKLLQAERVALSQARSEIQGLEQTVTESTEMITILLAVCSQLSAQLIDNGIMPNAQTPEYVSVWLDRQREGAAKSDRLERHKKTDMVIKIASYFDGDEIRGLAFDLGLDLGNEGARRIVLARELYAQAERKNLLKELINLIIIERPFLSLI